MFSSISLIPRVYKNGSLASLFTLPHSSESASGRTGVYTKGRSRVCRSHREGWWTGRSSKPAVSGLQNATFRPVYTHKHRDQGKMWVVADGQARSRKVMSWIQEICKRERSRSETRMLLPLSLGPRTVPGT